MGSPLTIAAIKELELLEAKFHMLTREIQAAEQYGESTAKKWKRREEIGRRLGVIRNRGISTNEMNMLIEEAASNFFRTIQVERTADSTKMIKVGWSNTLQAHIRIIHTIRDGKHIFSGVKFLTEGQASKCIQRLVNSGCITGVKELRW